MLYNDDKDSLINILLEKDAFTTNELKMCNHTNLSVSKIGSHPGWKPGFPTTRPNQIVSEVEHLGKAQPLKFNFLGE